MKMKTTRPHLVNFRVTTEELELLRGAIRARKDIRNMSEFARVAVMQSIEGGDAVSARLARIEEKLGIGGVQ